MLLNKHVRKEVAPVWLDLGLELLEQEDEEKLVEIRRNSPNDVSTCCKEMFKLWLEKSPHPSWYQLIRALKDIDCITIAVTIEEMLIGSGGKCIINDNIRMYV